MKETPLGGMQIGTTSAVSIRELPGSHTTDLRVLPTTQTRFAIEDSLGFTLPGTLGQAVQIPGDGEAYALCLAPDWWLIVGHPEAEEKFSPLRLTENHHFSSVDVSGQRTAIELEGPNAQAVLAHLWEQDLREKNFPIGSVSQGLMAKAPVILWYIAPFRYIILVRSSFALHLWKALVDSAKEHL
ncbi:MAG TPA: sarcosine oxidase subunit gamma family protein [Flavitalea sp.]|nr:sarcosine oxidase subunit gamma family protein [Flavitalea sp.]